LLCNKEKEPKAVILVLRRVEDGGSGGSFEGQSIFLGYLLLRDMD
jgi:hypothetical protein